MAVGAVNKDGVVEDYSAKGAEMEIVAPGELVKTTGFLGSEEVTSGTSLAAPQITAVAALIWQKDPSVSADFVRGLLDESANLYGKTDEYGNGLVDAEYALNHYEDYKKAYKKSTKNNEQILKVNDSEVETYEDTGCVEGCWNPTTHENMIDAKNYCVRAGARISDISTPLTCTTSDSQSYQFNFNDYFPGMVARPWWHGYFTTNYIKAAIFATRIAEAIYSYSTIERADNSFAYENATDMKQSVERFYDNNETGWNCVLGYVQQRSGTSAQTQKNTNGFKRAIVWGMAIHSATDIYAHSAENQAGHITHVGGNQDADNRYYIDARYYDAKAVAEQIMEKYLSKQALTANDLCMHGNYTVNYMLTNYDAYIRAVDSSITGYHYIYTTK